MITDAYTKYIYYTNNTNSQVYIYWQIILSVSWDGPWYGGIVELSTNYATAAHLNATSMILMSSLICCCWCFNYWSVQPRFQHWSARNSLSVWSIFTTIIHNALCYYIANENIIFTVAIKKEVCQFYITSFSLLVYETFWCLLHWFWIHRWCFPVFRVDRGYHLGN